jgi:hypothetical protein
VRLSAFLLAVSFAGVVVGAAVGCAVIADSAALAVWALLRDVPDRAARGDQLDLIRNRRAG